MPERHFHFGLLTLLWLYLAIVVVANLTKYVVNEVVYIPGFTELVNNT